MDPRCIECPSFICQKMLPCRNVVDHLKDAHNSPVCPMAAPGITRGEYLIQWQYQWATSPGIAKIDGKTFFLNYIMRDLSMIFWITILGNQEEAQRYEVKITAAPETDTTIKARRKVYSTDTSKEDVLKDPSGILKISKDLTDSMVIMGYILMDYHIIRK